MAEQGNPETGATPPASAQPTASGACRRRGRGRAVIFVVLVALLAGLAGSLATTAFSHGGYGYGPWGGFRFMDPATIDRRIERVIKHAAIEIDANKEQEDKLIAIAKAAARDLQPLREKLRSARQQAVDLFGQPAVDRAAIEKLRADQLATFDDMSKRLSKAIADAAEVLTPAQRKEIADRWPPFGGWHGRWHRH